MVCIQTYYLELLLKNNIVFKSNMYKDIVKNSGLMKWVGQDIFGYYTWLVSDRNKMENKGRKLKINPAKLIFIGWKYLKMCFFEVVVSICMCE